MKIDTSPQTWAEVPCPHCGRVGCDLLCAEAWSDMAAMIARVEADNASPLPRSPPNAPDCREPLDGSKAIIGA